jgi:hypothetical protein
MTSHEKIPDNCPKCGGVVSLRLKLEPSEKGKEWRCAKGCMARALQ